MKTLLLLRHAKSSWDDPAIKDIVRPLNRRGRQAAVRIGRLMREQGLSPDHVLCSTAARTRETWELAISDWNHRFTTQFLDELYECPCQGLSPMLRAVADDMERVLLIGHNPGLADFLAESVGFHEKFPTAGLAWLTADITAWAEFSDETPLTLKTVWRPRDLA